MWEKPHCGVCPAQHPSCSANVMQFCVCVCVFVQETYGKLLAVEKYQDRLRAKGLFSSDVKTM